MNGVGTRLPSSRPSLPVGRLETNQGEVCQGSGTTCRPLADYPLQDYRELAAIELPMREDRKNITEAYGESGKFYRDNQNHEREKTSSTNILLYVLSERR